MTNVEARIRSSYGSLSDTERKAADYFLNHMEASYSLPIAQLAQEAGVSPTAWVRLCKAVGYEGLKEMRKHLLVERMNEPQDAPEDKRYFSDLNEGSDVAQILQTVSNTSIQAIRDTAKMLDQNALYQAANCILKAATIRLFGVGASALVAEDLYHKLTRNNRYAMFSLATAPPFPSGMWPCSCPTRAPPRKRWKRCGPQNRAAAAPSASPGIQKARWPRAVTFFYIPCRRRCMCAAAP